MILKALYDYYNRLQSYDGSLAPYGFKMQEIPFVIVIDKDGNLQRIEDRRIDKKQTQKFLVLAGAHSNGVSPLTMYDNLEYALCHCKDGKIEKTNAKHKSFVARCAELADKYAGCEVFQAVKAFYANGGVEKVKNDPMWEEMLKKVGANVSFMLAGQTEIAASAQALENEVSDDGIGDDGNPVCLITGVKAPAVTTSGSTMIPGSQAIAKLVSFQQSSGYDSYGKSQGANAPISKKAEAAYTTALLRLLDKQSNNKFMVGDRTFVFWASSNSEAAKASETSIFYLLGNVDDPNEKIDKVKEAFMSIYSGKLHHHDDDRFFILGLAPNSARIAVVYWSETSLRDFSAKMLQHFNDLEIIDGRKEKKPYYGLRSLMSAVTLGGKQSEVQPNLPDATVKSIFQGLPYPFTLFSAAMRRIRAEQGDPMQIARLAIIKGYLNRLRNNNSKKIEVMLDPTNDNPGYLCGRLFATLEYAQQRANNASTIRERYMNSASATPAAVFATLLNLSVHHAEKLSDGARIYLENLKQEIIGMLPADGFPAHLDLQDQGRFFLGYYHQRQDFYTKKDQN